MDSANSRRLWHAARVATRHTVGNGAVLVTVPWILHNTVPWILHNTEDASLNGVGWLTMNSATNHELCHPTLKGAALNGVAWTGLKSPTILWTYNLDHQTDAELDAFFQQHLAVNVR
jgi:hypothetical protein